MCFMNNKSKEKLTQAQSGFLLLESLLALTVITLGLAIYSPATSSFLNRMAVERRKTDMLRVMVEEAEKWKEELPTDSVTQRGKETWTIQTIRTPSGKGIQITNGHEKAEIYLLQVPTATGVDQTGE